MGRVACEWYRVATASYARSERVVLIKHLILSFVIISFILYKCPSKDKHKTKHSMHVFLFQSFPFSLNQSLAPSIQAFLQAFFVVIDNTSQHCLNFFYKTQKNAGMMQMSAHVRQRIARKDESWHPSQESWKSGPWHVSQQCILARVATANLDAHQSHPCKSECWQI